MPPGGTTENGDGSGLSSARREEPAHLQNGVVRTPRPTVIRNTLSSADCFLLAG
jgi:hypothetical protein